MSKPPPIDSHRLVEVVWMDAKTARAGWKGYGKMKKQKPVRVRSVGWLLKDGKKHITLVSTMVDEKRDRDGDGDVTIVRGMVKKVRDLVSVKRGKV